MSHTPGPWTCRKDAVTRFSESWHIYGSDGTCVARAMLADDEESNVRLMAASPALFSACLQARTALEAAVGDTAQLDAAIEAITAAVKKASRLADVLANEKEQE